MYNLNVTYTLEIEGRILPSEVALSRCAKRRIASADHSKNHR